jgi:hypothetical protein
VRRYPLTLCSLTGCAPLPSDPLLTHRLHTDFHPCKVRRLPKWRRPLAAMVCVEEDDDCGQSGSQGDQGGGQGDQGGGQGDHGQGQGQSGGQGRSSLRIWLADTGLEHVVTPPPHHLLVWAGNVPHSGGAYAAFNVRCFAYVDHASTRASPTRRTRSRARSAPCSRAASGRLRRWRRRRPAREKGREP